MIVSPATVVQEARAWIGTPYQHQASVKHQGADCLGLVRGIWRELIGQEPEMPPAYSADWSEAAGDERLWQAADRNMISVKTDVNAFGDVLLFRMRKGSVAKHLGILAAHHHGFPTFIHAYSGKGVTETPFTQAWRHRLVAQFRFPSRSD